MKVVILDQHTGYCDIQTEKHKEHEYSRICEHSFSHFLFMCGGEFFLLQYHPCRDMHKYDFYEDIIRSVYSKTNTNKLVEVSRERPDEDLKAMRLKGARLKKYAVQINYIYRARGHFYCINSKVPYVDKIAWQDELTENATKALAELDEQGYGFLKDDLIRLVEYNMYFIPEAEILKSIKHLTEEIIKQVNN